MKKKTILMTGVSGVIGQSLTLKLIDHFRILAIGSDYSRIPQNIRHHRNFKFYEKNFLTVQSFTDLKIPEPIDIILHLAGAVSGSEITEEEYFQINAESTRILLQLGKQKKIRAFCLASSVSVYGSQAKPLQLTSDRLGASVYARSKIAAENYCISGSLPYSIFRIASVYGQGTKSFISKLLTLFRKGIYPSLRNETPKSIIHVEDVVSALLCWVDLINEGKSPRNIYVLSHPDSVTITKVISEFRSQKKSKFRGIGIPIFPIVIPCFNFLYKLLRKIKGKPYHESPLNPLLFSIEIFDRDSWQKLALSPKWDLRKGIAEYK